MAPEDIPILIPHRRVSELTGLERSAIYDRIQRNEFPAPVHLGSSSVRWVLAGVVRWIQVQIDTSGEANTNRQPNTHKAATNHLRRDRARSQIDFFCAGV